MEYGIFTDEGCIDRDFWSVDEAEIVRVRDYSEDGAYVAPMSRDQDDCEAGYEDDDSDESDND